MQAATENITGEIRQENEKLSEKLTQKLHNEKLSEKKLTQKLHNEKLSKKLTQKLHNEVKTLSSDICTLRNDTERKCQEVTTAIEGVRDSLTERIDHMR